MRVKLVLWMSCNVDGGHVLEIANLGVDITCKCSGLSQFFGHFLIPYEWMFLLSFVQSKCIVCLCADCGLVKQ